MIGDQRLFLASKLCNKMCSFEYNTVCRFSWRMWWVTLVFMWLSLHASHCTVHLEASWLGDPSLFHQEDFTTLLWNLTNASSVSIEPMSVDMLLGKNARVIFPNSSVYSFSIVYVTHLRFELEVSKEPDVVVLLGLNLATVALHTGMGFLVVDFVNTFPRSVASSAFQWPEYTATVAVGGWSATMFVCLLLVFALVVNIYYPISDSVSSNTANVITVKTARAPVLKVPQYGALPAARSQRELLLKMPVSYTRT